MPIRPLTIEERDALMQSGRFRPVQQESVAPTSPAPRVRPISIEERNALMDSGRFKPIDVEAPRAPVISRPQPAAPSPVLQRPTVAPQIEAPIVTQTPTQAPAQPQAQPSGWKFPVLSPGNPNMGRSAVDKDITYAGVKIGQGVLDVLSGAMRGAQVQNPVEAGMQLLGKEAPPSPTEWARKHLTEWNDAIEAKGIKPGTYLGKTAGGIGRSLLTMGVGLVGGAPGMIGAATMVQVDQSINEGKKAGLSGPKLALYVASQAAFEAGIASIFQVAKLGGAEALPFAKGLFSKGIKPALKELAKQTTAENVEEVLTSWGQALTDKVSGVNDMTWQQFGEITLDTLAQTTGTMGLVSVARAVMDAKKKIKPEDLEVAPVATEAIEATEAKQVEEPSPTTEPVTTPEPQQAQDIEAQRKALESQILPTRKKTLQAQNPDADEDAIAKIADANRKANKPIRAQIKALEPPTAQEVPEEAAKAEEKSVEAQKPTRAQETQPESMQELDRLYEEQQARIDETEERLLKSGISEKELDSHPEVKREYEKRFEIERKIMGVTVESANRALAGENVPSEIREPILRKVYNIDPESPVATYMAVEHGSAALQDSELSTQKIARILIQNDLGNGVDVDAFFAIGPLTKKGKAVYYEKHLARAEKIHNAIVSALTERQTARQPQLAEPASEAPDIQEAQVVKEPLTTQPTKEFEVREFKTQEGAARWRVPNIEHPTEFGFGDTIHRSLEDAQNQVELNIAKKRDSERRASEKEKDSAKKANERQEALNTDGFADQFKGVKAESIRSTLNKEVSVRGVLAARKKHIKSLVAEGYRVSIANGQRRLSNPDGRFFTEKDLSKTGLDYAEHLSKSKSERDLQKTAEDVPETDFGNKQPLTGKQSLQVQPPTINQELTVQPEQAEAPQPKTRGVKQAPVVSQEATTQQQPAPVEQQPVAEQVQPAPAPAKPIADETQAAWTVPQDPIKRAGLKQQIQDMIETKRANRKTVPQHLLDRLASIEEADAGLRISEGVGVNVVYGSPLYDAEFARIGDETVRINDLLPIKATSRSGLDWRIEKAQGIVDKLQARVMKRKGVKPLSTEEEHILDELRNQTLPELNRLMRLLPDAKTTEPAEDVGALSEGQVDEELGKYGYVSKRVAQTEAPAPSLGGAAKKLSKAAKALGKAAKEAGGGGRVGIIATGPFNRENYQRAKAQLDIAWKNTVEAGKEIADFIRAVLAQHGPSAKPYVLTYIREKEQGGNVEPRPKLANPATSIPARKFVNIVDAMREASGEPDVRHDEEVEQEADIALQDKESVKAQLLNVGESGGQLNDVGTVAAKQIVNDSAMQAIVTGDDADIESAIKVAEAYRDTGTEQGRAMRLRRDMLKGVVATAKSVIADAITMTPVSIAGRIKRVRAELKKKNLSPERKQRLQKMLDKLRTKEKENVKTILKELKAAGYDTNSLESYMKDQYKLAHIQRIIASNKSSCWDAQFELYRNITLSAFVTQSKNTLGNIGNATWDFTIQRMAEAALNVMVRDPGSTTLGDYKHIVGGMGPGFRRALHYAVLAFRTELPSFESEIAGSESHHRMETTPHVSIKGRKGRVIRTPQRLMLGMDEAAKCVVAHMTVGAEALHLGRTKGLQGDALTSFIEQEVANLQSKSWSKAIDKAVDLAFQKNLGEAGQKILALRKGVPGSRYIFLFVVTPANILKTGIRKTPLGTLSMLNEMRGPEFDKSRFVKLGAEQLVAYALTAGLIAALSGDDDDLPLITGSIPIATTKIGERDLAKQNTPSTSFRLPFGKTYYDFSGVEPFATVLTTIVDGITTVKNAQNGKDLHSAFGELFAKFGQQIKDKSSMRGLGDVLDAFDDPNYVPSLASNFASSWVPNILRSTLRSKDPYVRDMKPLGQGDDLKKFGETVLYKAFPASWAGLYPKVDKWGREITKDQGNNAYTDFLFRVTSPVKTLDVSERLPQDRQLDRLILNYNNAHPNDTFAPETPDPNYTKNGKKVYYSEKEYYDFCKAAGGRTLELLKDVPLNTAQPTNVDIDIIKSAISQARSETRARMQGEKVKSEDSGSEAIIARVAGRLATRKPKTASDIEEWESDRAEALEYFQNSGMSRRDILRTYGRNLLKQGRSVDSVTEYQGRLAGALGHAGIE